MSDTDVTEAATILAHSDPEALLVMLCEAVTEMREDLNAVLVALNEARAGIDGFAAQVQPTIDTLSAHPMFKMMFGGK